MDYTPTRPELSTPSDVAGLIADKVERALKRDRIIEEGALPLSARVAGVAAAAIASLPSEERHNIDGTEDELAIQIRRLVETFGGGATRRTSVASADDAGAGNLPADVEGWAGPLAGSTEIERRFGISRSTLHRWQRLGEVVAFLKGRVKHVFPTEQFIDGRPAKGIPAVIATIRDPRAAWQWLSRPEPALAGNRPIDMLKRDHIDEVVAAARLFMKTAG